MLEIYIDILVLDEKHTKDESMNPHDKRKAVPYFNGALLWMQRKLVYILKKIVSTYPLIDSDRPGAEGDALAERLHATRDGAIAGDAHILAVDRVEAERGQVVRSAADAGGRSCG